jgi:hypothetical protein
MTSSNRSFGISRRSMLSTFAALAMLPMLAVSALAQTSGADPLPSWNDTAPKKAIVTFVERMTRQGSPDFVPPAERIATFDNDGTLWAEQPLYVQLVFALDRVKVLAPQHPEWKDKEPFASLLKGDLKGALAGGEAAIGKSQQLDPRKHERRLAAHIRVRRDIVREAFCCLIARFRQE